MKTPIANQGVGRKARKPRVQLNLEVVEKMKLDAQLCAMLEKTTVREWCISVINEAVSRTLKEKGVQSPFDRPATPFRNNAIEQLCVA